MSETRLAKLIWSLKYCVIIRVQSSLLEFSLRFFYVTYWLSYLFLISEREFVSLFYRWGNWSFLERSSRPKSFLFCIIFHCMRLFPVECTFYCSFNKILVNSYHIPGIILSIRNTAWSIFFLTPTGSFSSWTIGMYLYPCTQP